MSVCGTGVLRPLVKAAATQTEPEGSDDDFDGRVKSNKNKLKGNYSTCLSSGWGTKCNPNTTNKAHPCRQNSSLLPVDNQ